MLTNMFKVLFITTCVAASVYGAGEFVILHSSPGVKFSGHEEVDQSMLKHVFSSALGFSTNKDSKWSGMEIKDPFHYPVALFVLVVDGVRSLSVVSGWGEIDTDDDSVTAEAVFPLVTDEDESVTLRALEMRIRKRYPSAGLGGNLTFIRAVLSDEDSLPNQWKKEEILPFSPAEEAEWKALRENEEENQALFQENFHFFSELVVLGKIVNGAVHAAEKKGVSGPDVYWLVLRGLHPLIDLNGEGSEQSSRAIQILSTRARTMANLLAKAYDNRVLVAVVTTDASHTRRTRSVKADIDDPDLGTLRLSKEYGIYYPVMFNIFLWFMVAFFFALIAISLAIATMDPGRDSIIYRMTSSSMKKDN
ncbi:ATPase H(+)-transporting accessory protein 2 [Ischnura elegans]|uniref:ATPase H(+)-transporting accessory protein 2 n=1 Tax=Ischnura elegans TaxID=197161 RepID=UPI001ED8B085|nr:ATPase H(+)-transporting accessory protein 2 [Ischnura elegans]